MKAKAKQVIIIGSGVAGMATAIRLAAKGFQVTVYEQQATPGGKLSSFTQQGFHFDKGPSLFTEPENIKALFDLAGEQLEDYFNYKTCPSHCNYFWDDGTSITAYSDLDKFEEELHTKLGEQRGKLQRYLKQSADVYKNIASTFLNFSLHRWSTWINVRSFKALKYLKLSLLTKTLHQYNAAIFSHSKTVQLFDRYATYNGSNPYTAPAMLSVIPHVEYNAAAYYASGGMITITEAIYKLAVKLGVSFKFNSTVDRIICQSNVSGIVVNGNNVFADIVVSNIDAYYVYKNLLLDDATAKKILKQERSSSACIFYWGMGRKFNHLSLHNIFFTGNYQQEFEHIFKKKQSYGDPTVYVNVTSKQDENHAPAGKENWFVMVNVPAADQRYDAVKLEELRAQVIGKISAILKVDVREIIETERIIEPADIDTDTGSYMGSLYGTSSNARLAAFVRHPNFSKKINGLYFCGGSVHPGGGIPLCLKSAAIVSDLIVKKYK